MDRFYVGADNFPMLKITTTEGKKMVLIVYQGAEGNGPGFPLVEPE